MADALAIDQIALAEVRLLREAKLGNATALRALLEPHVDRLWSISSAVLPETDALAAIGSFQENLRREILSFGLEQSFAVQLYGALWQHLSTRTQAQIPTAVELVEPFGIGAAAGQSRPSVHEVLHQVPPFSRLVFVFQLITGLPVSRLAALTHIDEPILRAERARVLLTLHRVRYDAT